MRVKVRYTTGSMPPVVLNILDTDPVSSFIVQIREAGEVSGEMEIRFGFPPEVLDLGKFPPGTPICELPFKLDGEQLTVEWVKPSTPTPRSPVRENENIYRPPRLPVLTELKPRSANLPADEPLRDDPPEIRLPDRGTVVLRVMEDDNSCLFRAISYLLTDSMTSPAELRQIVTTTIVQDQLTYNEGVLGLPVDDYCDWISRANTWGGGIELSILARFFDVEIVAIDVATGSAMRFNDPQTKFCIVIYSGVHYDALALSPITATAFSSSPDKDIRIFESEDEGIFVAAREMVRKLKQRKYYTDVKKFTLRCCHCRIGVVGEAEARRHAEQSGHSDFEEY